MQNESNNLTRLNYKFDHYILKKKLGFNFFDFKS